MTRNICFEDPLFEEFAMRPLIMDGCPLGEISTTTSLIEEGDRDGWYLQWTATAERIAGYADESARAGHIISASDAYLRASSYYRAAYLPLYSSPVDPRLVEAFDKEATAFQTPRGRPYRREARERIGSDRRGIEVDRRGPGQEKGLDKRQNLSTRPVTGVTGGF